MQKYGFSINREQFLSNQKCENFLSFRTSKTVLKKLLQSDLNTLTFQAYFH